ncbi:glycosyltransferase family 39 protein [Nanoarchaeota archaeon]
MNKERAYKVAIVSFALLLFFSYSFIALNSPNKFTSPDENSYYHFTKRFAEGKEIPSPVPDIENSEHIYPRNAVYYEGKLYPKGFLGIIIIYGLFGRLHIGLLPLMTPLIGLLGIVFLFFLIKDLFGKETAILSTIIVAFLPPYLFWSNMNFYNNAPTAAFFIGGLLFLFRYLKDGKKQDIGISAALFALATWFRYETSVLIALTMGYVVLVRISKKKFNLEFVKDLAIFSVLFLIVLSPVLYYNTKLFGGPMSLGYNVAKGINGNGESEDEALFEGLAVTARRFLMPAGFWPSRMVVNGYNFILNMLPLYTILSLLGVFLFLRMQNNHLQKMFFGIALLVSLYLLTYYGSGFFYGYDQAPLLSSSYVRYFLPIYMMMGVFAGISLKKMMDYNKLIFIFIFVILLSSSVTFAFFSNQAIIATNSRRNSYLDVENYIERMTPPDAIILTRYWDKAIFPTRQVMTRSFINEDHQHIKLAALIFSYKEQGMEIYYLNDRRVDLPTLTQELRIIGLDTRKISSRFGGLYQIIYD